MRKKRETCISDLYLDLYAVAVKKLDSIIRHVPRTISTLCHLFLSRGRSITCSTVTGIRKYSDDLLQGSLEVPCQLTFRGDEPAVEKVKNASNICSELLESLVANRNTKVFRK